MTPATPKLVSGVIPKGSDFGLKALVGWNGLDPKGLAGVFGVADTELILVGSRGGRAGGGRIAGVVAPGLERTFSGGENGGGAARGLKSSPLSLESPPALGSKSRSSSVMASILLMGASKLMSSSVSPLLILSSWVASLSSVLCWLSVFAVMFLLLSLDWTFPTIPSSLMLFLFMYSWSSCLLTRVLISPSRCLNSAFSCSSLANFSSVLSDLVPSDKNFL